MADLAHSKALRADNPPSRIERRFNNSVEWVKATPEEVEPAVRAKAYRISLSDKTVTGVVGNLKRALNQQLGRDPETPLLLTQPLHLRPRPLPYDSLQTELLNNNEDLALARQRITLSEQGLELAATAYKPTVQLYANVNYLNQSDDANFLLQNRNFGSEAGARVSYTLFDGGLRDIQQQNARLELEQSRQQRATTELELLTLLRQAHATYENGRAQLAFEQSNLPLFEHNFEKCKRITAPDRPTSRACERPN